MEERHARLLSEEMAAQAALLSQGARAALIPFRSISDLSGNQPQKKAGSASYFCVVIPEFQNDCPDGVCSPCMRDAHLRQSVASTRVGGKYPQCLRVVIPVEGPTAGRAFIWLHWNKDSVSDGSPNHVSRVVRAGDRSPDTEHGIAPHLRGRHPVWYISLTRALNWHSCFQHRHETRHGAQVCGDVNYPSLKIKLIKSNGDFCAGTSSRRENFDNVSLNLLPLRTSEPPGKGTFCAISP